MTGLVVKPIKLKSEVEQRVMSGDKVYWKNFRHTVEFLYGTFIIVKRNFSGITEESFPLSSQEAPFFMMVKRIE